MYWIGKIGGAMLGYLLAGPIGALVGVLLGHQFDKGMARFGAAGVRPQVTGAARQQVFFETTFLVMGHVAKADGRVSEEEIQAARTVMHRLRLHPEAVRRAIDLFTAGKQPRFDLDAQLREFRRVCGREAPLVRAFLEFQMDLVLSKGGIKPRERELLWRMAEALGLTRVELAQLEAVLRAQHSFGRKSRTAERQRGSLDQAYKALGVTPEASDRDVKLAYRRLMNQHHPDKLASRGLPDAMLEAAKERTGEISAAYDLIRKHRGIK